MQQREVRQAGYRSFFWPLLLIAIGVMWLLANVGLVPMASITTLVQLWPLVLGAIALDLLFGRKSPAIGALIGVVLVLIIMGVALLAPVFRLGSTSLKPILELLQEPVDNATRAEINLSLSLGDTYIYALDETDLLFKGHVVRVGELNYVVEGTERKVISLREEIGALALDLLGATLDDHPEIYWELGLNPDLPLDIDIYGGVGAIQLDLSALNLTGFSMEGTIGPVQLYLPAAPAPYTARIAGGAGSVDVMIADGAAVNLDVSGGMGNVMIDIPEASAVQLNGTAGLGNISVLETLLPVGDEGDVWETPGFAEADQQIVINFSGGVGNLIVE